LIQRRADALRVGDGIGHGMARLETDQLAHMGFDALRRNAGHKLRDDWLQLVLVRLLRYRYAGGQYAARQRRRCHACQNPDHLARLQKMVMAGIFAFFMTGVRHAVKT